MSGILLAIFIYRWQVSVIYVPLSTGKLCTIIMHYIVSVY